MAKLFQNVPVRFVFFLVAITIYALWGSPTPDQPGWAEGLMGLFLLLACGAPSIGALTAAGPRPTLKIFLLYGMTVPLLAGCLRGHDPLLIARDIFPFLFLCLPLFLTGVAGHSARTLHLYIYAICGLGLAFALRALGPAYGYLPPAGELYYLSNAPTVLFAAIFMAGVAMDRFTDAPRASVWAKGFLALASVIVILWAMLLDTQRATIGAIIFSIMVFYLAAMLRAPRRVIVPTAIILALVLSFLPVFDDAAQAIAGKTAKVGLNMRLEELNAVIDTVSPSFMTMLFGMGWGAKMASPAVAGIEVNFTHSLLTYLLLKTGLCGLVLTLTWLIRVGADIRTIMGHNLVPGFALVWAVAIPVVLYASHKSLDFGLILLLVAVLADGFKGRVATAKSDV